MAGYLIRGATVHDGTGAPGRRADVAIEGERIAAVGPGLPRGDGRETIDGDGLVLAPGFIDLHSHADFTLPAFPEARNSLTQGVTSEVIGNCGFSPAPVELTDDREAKLRALTGGIGPELDFSWQSFGEYLAYLDAKRPAVNVMALVGHSALRIAAMGMDDRPATPAELAEMRRLLRESIDQGAWGFSTGLVYPPGSYGGTDEVIEIGRALTETNALYASHIRNESDDVHVALKEALDIGRTLGVRTEISHLKAAGRQNHGRLPELVGMLDEARASGLDVHSDGYPYDAGSTMLNQLIPPWAHDGGIEALVERLRSPEQRARMRHDIEHGLPGWQNLVRAAGTWDRIIVASVDPSGPRLGAGEDRRGAVGGGRRGAARVDDGLPRRGLRRAGDDHPVHGPARRGRRDDDADRGHGLRPARGDLATTPGSIRAATGRSCGSSRSTCASATSCRWSRRSTG